jgi:DNA-binding transcriptional MerR regulator
MEYRIGDFSLMSRLPVKTLRYYHEIGILEPSRVDAATGYRWYDDESLRRAGLVRRLRELDFGLEEIAEIARDEADGKAIAALARLEDKARELGERIERYRRIKSEIEGFLADERESESEETPGEVETAEIEELLVASVGYRGRYSDIGRRIGGLYREFGRWADGPCFALYRELEYSEDAEIEVCLPLRRDSEEAAKSRGGGSVEALPGCRALCLVHRGPYEKIGDSYRRVFGFVAEKGLRIASPVREVYCRGPGAILPRSPKSYRTRLIVPILAVL